MICKPCPWCGGLPSLKAKSLGGPRDMGYPGNFLYYMQCDTCLSTAPGGKWDDIYRSTKDAKRIAVEVWNKRIETQDDVQNNFYREKVAELAEEMGIHNLYAMVKEIRGE